MSEPQPLAVSNVDFSYSADVVLSNVSFELNRGEFVALVGPNASGKSTLLKLILGLLEPDSGTCRLFGERSSKTRNRWRIGYVPQRPTIAPDLNATVKEIVATGRVARERSWFPSKRNNEAIDNAMSEVGLRHLADVQVRDLSGGQQQRVFIARALASEPELLILDEPVAGVDAASQNVFRDELVHLVKEHSVAVLLVSHELSAVAESLDRVVVLKSGSIVFDGPPSELQKRGVSLGIHAEDLPIWLEEPSK